MPDDKNNGVNKNVVLAISVLASFAGALMFSSTNVILPTIGKDLGAGAVLLGWVVSVPSLTMAAIMLPLGRIADIYGRKKIFLYGTLIGCLGFFLGGMAGSVPLLICFQIIQGVGNGIVVGTSVAIITSVFPLTERGKAIGIIVTAVYIGGAMGPFLGGMLTQFLSWRSVFFLCAVLLLLAAILIILKLKGEWVDAQGEKFDLVGSVFLAVSLVLIVYGFSRLPEKPGIVFVPLGLAGLLLFAWWEKRDPNPVLNIDLFLRNKTFIFSNLSVLAHYTAFTSMFLLSLYLQNIRGFTPSNAGLIMLVHPVCMAVVASISGRLSDRIEPRKIAAAGLALIFAALVILSFFIGYSSLWLIVICLVVLGVGTGLFSSPNTNAVMSAVEKKHLGVASASVGMMRSIGGSLGMALTMIIISVYIGDVQITTEYFHGFLTSMRVVFGIVSLIVLIGFFSQLASRKKTSDIV